VIVFKRAHGKTINDKIQQVFVNQLENGTNIVPHPHLFMILILEGRDLKSKIRSVWN